MPPLRNKVDLTRLQETAMSTCLLTSKNLFYSTTEPHYWWTTLPAERGRCSIVEHGSSSSGQHPSEGASVLQLAAADEPGQSIRTRKIELMKTPYGKHFAKQKTAMICPAAVLHRGKTTLWEKQLIISDSFWRHWYYYWHRGTEVCQKFQ